MKKLNLALPDELFEKVDIAAKALWITRSDYIRQALARAVKLDEDFIDKHAPIFTSNNIQEDDEDTKLLRKYGMLD